LRARAATDLAPLASTIWAEGRHLDHHKSFVVRYRMGEDVQLNRHYDNAEVTRRCTHARMHACARPLGRCR